MHAPPTKPEPPSGGLAYALMPAMGSFGLIAFAFVYDNPLFIYIGVGMAFLAILMAIGIRVSQARSVKKKRRRNRRRYRDYLSSVERDLAHDAGLQLAASDRIYPDHERLWGMVLRRRNLWERRVSDPDFLEVRVGRGQVAHTRPIVLDLGDDPLTDRERDLEDEASTVHKRWQRVNDLPLSIDLEVARVVSVVGPPAAGRALARSLVSQLAAFRAPGDLRMLAAFAPEHTADWEWMKWLPHARSQAPPRAGTKGPPRPDVLLADSPERLARLLDSELSPRIEQLQRIEDQGPQVVRESRLDAPRLIVFVDGYAPDAPVAKLASIRDAIGRGRSLEVSLILLCDTLAHEPSEADVRVVLSDGAAATVEERGRDERRRTEGVWPDAADAGLCEAMARSLAPLRLEDRDAERGVADDVRLLDLLGHPSPATIDPDVSWRQRSPRERLRVPIGVSAAGEPLALDLKEAAQGGIGPHGLIVGATGSGKSELLRTLVAGLALGHPPEELAFVLIDYKGGSAFAELSRLPHTAGLITNLQRDEALVDRMRDALLGEQERRQSMLRDAGDLDDIGSYRAARERDPALAPMPHLLVIVDEFGELLAARSEFIDLFLGIGRVGRSLGMHLLFSSQRLDEGKLRGLESNLRYRICLRTYSATESKLVLGTPDAYLLPPYPGAAYLKVDTGIYERFKVGLVSGSKPTPATPLETGPQIEVFDSALGEVAETDEDAPGRSGDPGDLEQIVSLLAAAHAGRNVHQVWVAPLAAELDLSEVLAGPAWWERSERTGGLAAPAGLLDVPAEQRTEPLLLDFEGSTGHLALIGAPQSGKSTFLRTLTCTLAQRYRPDEARLYLLDLAGGGLSSLASSPNVSDISSKVEADRVRQTVRHVRGLLAKRMVSFRALGLGSMRDARVARGDDSMAGEDLADIFLVVDGWAVLRHDFEGLELEFEQLAAEGLNFGVHLIVAANRWAEMRPNLRDNLGLRLELRLNDPIDSEHGKRIASTVPTDTPGRGLSAESLHFQAARDDPALLAEAGRRWAGPAVPPVPVLPARLAWSELPRDDGRPGIPIGVEELDLDPVRLDLTSGDPHFVVLGDGEAGKTNLLRVFARGLMADQDPGRARLTVVDYRRTLLDLSDAPHVRAYAANAAMATQAIGELRAELTARLPAADASGEELLRGPSWTGPRHYLLLDDYDLVPSATENPLLSLVDLLAHGRDIGLHVILARRVGGIMRSSFGGDPFYQRLTELRSPGLLMSGDREEGTVLGGLRPSHLPAGRGTLVSRDHAAGLVQVAIAPSPGEQDQEPERPGATRLHG